MKYLLVSTLFILGCVTHTPQSSDQVKLKSFWVKDTLIKANTGFRKINRFSPLPYENQIIIANSLDGVISYNKSTQKEAWRFPVRYGVEASGLIAGNVLFFGGLDGAMYSVNADNGSLIWKFDTSHEIVAEPLLENGTLYFLNSANSLFALDADSGKQIWVYNRQETNAKMTIRGGSRPSYSQGFVYVGFSDGSVLSINAKTGTPQWEMTLNKNLRFKDIDSSPVIDGDNIYVNSYDDKLYCLSKSNGQIVWKSEFGGSSTPVISGQRIINSSSKQQIVALNKTDGSVIWKKNINGASTDPVLAKGYVTIGESQGKIKLFDLLSGELKADFDPGRGIMSKIFMDKDTRLYFISGEGNLYGILIDNSVNLIPYIVN